MKVFFSLIVFSVMMATCYGECFGAFDINKKDGTRMLQSTCVDIHDGKRHLVGSTWKTAHCYSCECQAEQLTCCKKFGGVAHREGCIAVENLETCEYDFYLIDVPKVSCSSVPIAME